MASKRGYEKISEGESPDEPTPPAPATVTLRNRTLRELLFNLPCAVYCAAGECVCERHERTIAEYDHRNQEHVMKVVERRICASVGFLSGETKEVDPRALLVNDISAAIARGDLVRC